MQPKIEQFVTAQLDQFVTKVHKRITRKVHEPNPRFILNDRPRGIGQNSWEEWNRQIKGQMVNLSHCKTWEEIQTILNNIARNINGINADIITRATFEMVYRFDIAAESSCICADFQKKDIREVKSELSEMLKTKHPRIKFEDKDLNLFIHSYNLLKTK